MAKPRPAHDPATDAAARARARAQVERLTCPVCMEVFRQPTLLPCHHTFCLSCLHDLLATSPRAARCEFRCPTCRTLVHVPPRGMSAFQSNFYLLPEELEAARGLAAQDVPGPSPPSPRGGAASPTAGDEAVAGTETDDGAGETTDDWLIAFLMNMEEQGGHGPSRPVSAGVVPRQGGGQDHRREGGGREGEDELRRALQESLRTYREELQRHQGRPQPGPPQEGRGLQAVVASEAFIQWLQRQQSGEQRKPRQQRTKPPERPQEACRCSLPERQQTNSDEVPRRRRSRDEHEHHQKGQDQQGEHKQGMPGKLNDVLKEFLNRRGEPKRGGQQHHHRRHEPQKRQEQQPSEFQKIFQRFQSRRQDTGAPKCPSGEEQTQPGPREEHQSRPQTSPPRKERPVGEDSEKGRQGPQTARKPSWPKGGRDVPAAPFSARPTPAPTWAPARRQSVPGEDYGPFRKQTDRFHKGGPRWQPRRHSQH